MSEYGPKYAHFRMGGYVSNSTGENAPRSGRRDNRLNRRGAMQRATLAVFSASGKSTRTGLGGDDADLEGEYCETKGAARASAKKRAALRGMFRPSPPHRMARLEGGNMNCFLKDVATP